MSVLWKLQKDYHNFHCEIPEEVQVLIWIVKSCQNHDFKLNAIVWRELQSFLLFFVRPQTLFYNFFHFLPLRKIQTYEMLFSQFSRKFKIFFSDENFLCIYLRRHFHILLKKLESFGEIHNIFVDKCTISSHLKKQILIFLENCEKAFHMFEFFSMAENEKSCKIMFEDAKKNEKSL